MKSLTRSVEETVGKSSWASVASLGTDTLTVRKDNSDLNSKVETA